MMPVLCCDDVRSHLTGYDSGLAPLAASTSYTKHLFESLSSSIASCHDNEVQLVPLMSDQMMSLLPGDHQWTTTLVQVVSRVQQVQNCPLYYCDGYWCVDKLAMWLRRTPSSGSSSGYWAS